MPGDKFDSSAVDEQTLKRDKVFRAIGELNRRVILEKLAAQPGLTVTELCDQFAFSRFAVMKHLNILEEAGLIERRQAGASKQLYLQIDPLADLQASWLEPLLTHR